MKTSKDRYPNFKYSANLLKKYFSGKEGGFSIMLKDGDIINYQPKDTESFRAWLDEHGVTDVQFETRWSVV